MCRHCKASFADSTAKVQIEVLHAKVVDMVVELAVKGILPQVGEGSHGIGYVASGNGRLRWREQSCLAQTGIVAPVGRELVHRR